MSLKKFWGPVLAILLLATTAGIGGSLLGASAAAPPTLASAATYAVIASSTITNTGPTVLTGDLGLSPGTAVTGFPPGTVVGTQHIADAAAAQAQVDVGIAYDNAAAQTPFTDLTGADLGGLTLTPGVYHFSSSVGITGTLTLDGQGTVNR
jgi:hypothetical protein